MAIIIRTGHKEDTAIDVAQRIISMDNRLSHLVDVTLEELTKIKGIGKCKAAQILATIEIGKRLNRWGAHDKIGLIL